MTKGRGAHECARRDAIGKGNPPLYEQGIGEPSRAGSEQGDTMRGGMPPRLADGLFYLFEVDVLSG